MSRYFRIYVSVLIVYLIELNTVLPVAPTFTLSQWNHSRPVGFRQSLVLLHRYGYMGANDGSGNPINIANISLPNAPGDEDSALELPPEGYTEALRRFQRQYNLSVTGRLDRQTASLLSAPRCGNPDTQEDISMTNPQWNSNHYGQNRPLHRVRRYQTAPAHLKWKKKLITWSIHNYPSRKLNQSRTRAVFSYAFTEYASVSGLDFKEVGYTDKADIVIKFGRTNHGDSIPFDGLGNVLAHAYFPPSDNDYSLSGDAHFDDDEPWSDVQEDDTIDLLSVAAHELGHSLGLGHSSNPDALMYPLYMAKWTRILLAEDDVTGIQSLYGPAEPGKPRPRLDNLPDIPYQPKTPTEPPGRDKNINFCNTSVDAIINVRNRELYISKNSWLWTITWSEMVTTWVSYQVRNRPTDVRQYWPILPRDVDHIDAGIMRNDQSIYLFCGTRFWILQDSKRVVPGFPSQGLPLTNLGLPENLEKVDTMFRWGENDKVYIFAGELYWRLDEGIFGKVVGSPEYPRKIVDTWQGLPVPLDAAFTDVHGETIFFKGTEYYAFDNIAMKTRENYPKPSKLALLGCIQDD